MEGAGERRSLKMAWKNHVEDDGRLVGLRKEDVMEWVE